MIKFNKIFGEKVLGVRVTPLTLKIVLIFILLLLVSNFSSNYINLTLNRGLQLKLMNQLLVKDLKELHLFATNQYEIYFFNEDLEATIEVMIENAKKQFTGEKSIALGVNSNGDIEFFATNGINIDKFPDLDALQYINDMAKKGTLENRVEFSINNDDYFGIYKYNPKWQYYIIRAEEKNEFYSETRRVFFNVAITIVLLTLLCATLGVFVMRKILKFVKIITAAIMDMNRTNKMELINLDGARPDEITYLGAALNATSSTIDTLMNIFRKFVTKDVALKAYEEKQIRLEGSKSELTILFSDIKRFTFITEALGTDIIQLLNTHYDNTFKPIHENDGIIGSIIGDALLAVFGTYKSNNNKSLEALDSGFAIQEETEKLRKSMHKIKNDIISKNGELTEVEDKVFKAVSLEVGVGIDGGEVFYGNIGSFSRMTNTVIGDNVNSSSRLEGLTRIYNIPIICSEYVKNEAEQHSEKYQFVEIDQVFVKGKTQGKRIFWPVLTKSIDEKLASDIENFNIARELYYKGDWVAASKYFQKIDLPFCSEFEERIKEKKPNNWSGIWTMTTK